MNGGDLDAARVIGGALRLVRGPAGGPVREQGQEFGRGDDLRKEWSRLFLGRSNRGRAEEEGRQSDNERRRFSFRFVAERLYSIDFNEAVCQDAIRESPGDAR